MATRMLIFDVKDLKDLLIHYTQGALIPLNSEVAEVGVSRFLARLISLNIKSPDWPTDAINPISQELQPARFLYAGKKTFSWTKEDGDSVKWVDANDTPKK